MVALFSIPLGFSPTVFWIYVAAISLLVIALFKIPGEVPRHHGLDKIMPFGRMFYAMPYAVFGSEHFSSAKDIAGLVPKWIPFHLFWTYLIGLGFLLAAVAIVLLVQARLAAAMVAFTMFSFVILMDIPGTIGNPHNRIIWALMLRELSFGAGGLAFALSPSVTRPSQSSPAPPRALAIPRIFIGITAVFYGVQHFLHPANVPSVPLEKFTPTWIPGHIALSYFVGAVLVLAGACLLVNKKTRLAATILGLTVLLTMFWVYLPILIAAPKELEALNYFFDTLLFCGTVLLLANAMPREAA